jgi:excisionase family DNA binding protein
MTPRIPTFEQLPELVSQILEQLNRIEEQLNRESNNGGDSFNELMSVQETAEFLNLSPATIYGLVSKRIIPFHKRTKRIYFFKTELFEYLRAGRKATIEELQNNIQLYTNKKTKK